MLLVDDGVVFGVVTDAMWKQLIDNWILTCNESCCLLFVVVCCLLFVVGKYSCQHQLEPQAKPMSQQRQNWEFTSLLIEIAMIS